MSIVRLRRAAVAVAVLAAVATAACGCGSSPDPLHQATDAAAKTLALTGTSYTLTLRGQQLFDASLQVAGAKAAYDLRRGLGYEAVTVGSPDGSTRRLFLDFRPTGVYLAPYPPPSGALPPGKVWIAVPLPGAGAAASSLAAQLLGLSAELPLAEVAWGGETAARVGTRVVQHVPSVEYRVTVDLAKALGAARRTGRPALAAAIAAELGGARSERVAVTVLVNGPGYVARIEHRVPGSGLGIASFAFSGYAVKFDRTRPPPDQIVTLASLRQGSRSLWAIATGT